MMTGFLTPRSIVASVAIATGYRVLNRYAIVGDTLFNIFRKSVFPSFADDQEELFRSRGKVYDTGCRYFYPGHGNPFGIDKFRQSLETGKKRREDEAKP